MNRKAKIGNPKESVRGIMTRARTNRSSNPGVSDQDASYDSDATIVMSDEEEGAGTRPRRTWAKKTRGGGRGGSRQGENSRDGEDGRGPRAGSSRNGKPTGRACRTCGRDGTGMADSLQEVHALRASNAALQARVQELETEGAALRAQLARASKRSIGELLAGNSIVYVGGQRVFRGAGGCAEDGDSN